MHVIQVPLHGRYLVPPSQYRKTKFMHYNKVCYKKQGYVYNTTTLYGTKVFISVATLWLMHTYLSDHLVPD